MLSVSDSLTRTALLRELQDRAAPVQAWSSFVDTYGPMILNWYLRWGLPRQDAEDMTQEALLRVYQKISQFQHRGPFTFRGWLRTVAKSIWLTAWRRRKTLAGQGLHPGNSPELDMLNASSRSRQIDEFEQIAQVELLNLAYERVRSRVRESSWHAFELIHHQGLPVEDVCEKLGLTKAAVYLASSRIRRMILSEVLVSDKS
jgi:RNA polymerase sigma-70 factor (ECF subfamily)